MARGGSRLPRENVPPSRDVSAPAPTAKIKFKSKNKQWKPLDLGDHNNGASATVDASNADPAAEVLGSPNTEVYDDGSAYSEGEPATAVGSSYMAVPMSEDDEISFVFPDGLPDPIYLRSQIGSQHGEIQYIKHPNRDVTAHQWSATYFEWVVVGCYSCVRKTIEGPVVSPDFLKLLGSKPERPSSLEYFCELAEEYSKRDQAEPTNVTVVSSYSNFKPNTGEESHRHGKAPIVAGPSTKDDDFPILGSLTLKTLKVPDTQATPIEEHEATKRAQSEEPAYLVTPLREHAFRDEDPFVEPPTALRGQMDRHFRFPSPNVGKANRRVRGTPSPHPEITTEQSRMDRKAFIIQQERDRVHQLLQGKQHLPVLPASDEAVKSQQSMPPQQLPPSAQVQVPTVATRDLMRGYLHRLGDDFRSAQNLNEWTAYVSPDESRPTEPAGMDFASEGGRTPVPRGPDRLRPLGPPPPRELVHPELANRPGTYLQPSQNAEAGKPPTSSGSQYSRRDLHTSDPEPGYEGRLVDVYNTSALSEALPTQQDFGGPFFLDDMPSASNPTAKSSTRMSYSEKLDKWWTSGNLSQRHDEHMKALAKTSKNDDPNKGFVTDRVLLPIYETLSSYVRQPGSEKEPDYFARFTEPPKFAIDRSRNGNDSFFGEDWGEVPKRIGRDPRYSMKSSIPPMFVSQRGAQGQSPSSSSIFGFPSSGPSHGSSTEDLGKLKGFGAFGDNYRTLPRGPRAAGNLQGFGFDTENQSAEMQGPGPAADSRQADWTPRVKLPQRPVKS